MNDHLHNAPAIRGRKPEPSRVCPCTAYESVAPSAENARPVVKLRGGRRYEVAIATKSQEEVEREGVETKLSGTEAAFDRLEATLRSTEAEYEAHVLSASARVGVNRQAARDARRRPGGVAA